MKRSIIGVALAISIISLGVFAYVHNQQNQAITAQNTLPTPTPELTPTPTPTPTPEPTPEPVLVPFTGRVEHIFFHPLIAYPELTFDDDYQAKGFDDWFVTVPEFNKIIESLYQKDFILVDVNDTFEIVEGKLQKKTLMLPEGKKPIIISVDDLNYYTYMIENGTVTKLVLDKNGDVVTYTLRPDGTEIYAKDNEIVVILDQFVKEHPDFSFNGAKGCLGLTGYEGALGYRTHKDSPNRQEEIQKVMPVIKRLKETGWTFASHSYGHRDAAKASFDFLKNDTAKWIDEVGSLVGDTQIYIYPYGSGLKVGDPKLNMLLDNGFKAFFHVGIESYYKFTDIAMIADRRHVDGIALRYQYSQNTDLYNAYDVLDPVRPSKYQEKPNK